MTGFGSPPNTLTEPVWDTMKRDLSRIVSNLKLVVFPNPFREDPGKLCDIGIFGGRFSSLARSILVRLGKEGVFSFYCIMKRVLICYANFIIFFMDANLKDLHDHMESILSKSLSLNEKDVTRVLRSLSFDDHRGSCKLAKMRSFGSKYYTPAASPEAKRIVSPKPLMNPDMAAVKLQKKYKSFRTRRQLANCAVLVEKRWLVFFDFFVSFFEVEKPETAVSHFVMLKCSSVSFFEVEKTETVVSRWSRARTRAVKVGKGLSKNEKARNFLYNIGSRPLDIWEGKEVNLEQCPRLKLQQQCIKYLGP
ncbi:hypothetical protein Ccrd_004191, partial [Cynara cardunculus var. scolymus]